MAQVDAANENDECRKRFEVICRELFIKIQGLYQLHVAAEPATN